MKPFIPNKKQWKSWPMPSKVGYISSVLGVISFVFAIYVWFFPNPPLGSDEKLLDVSGSVFLDDTPMVGAKVTLTGHPAEWPTRENGSFDFKIQDNGTDSLAFVISYSTEIETVRLDTTLAKTGLQGLQLHLRTRKLQTIAGHVLEQGTGKQIAGAKIILNGKRGQGESGEQGYFRFEARGKPFEWVEATVSHPNFVPATATIGLTLSEDNTIPMKMKK